MLLLLLGRGRSHTGQSLPKNRLHLGLNQALYWSRDQKPLAAAWARHLSTDPLIGNPENLLASGATESDHRMCQAESSGRIGMQVRVYR